VIAPEIVPTLTYIGYGVAKGIVGAVYTWFEDHDNFSWNWGKFLSTIGRVAFLSAAAAMAGAPPVMGILADYSINAVKKAGTK